MLDIPQNILLGHAAAAAGPLDLAGVDAVLRGDACDDRRDELAVAGGLLHGLLRGRGPAIFFEYVPHLFQERGTDPMEVFTWLASEGYSQFTMFTNFGERLIAVNSEGLDAVAQLATYSAVFRRIHYDVMAVKPRHEG